MKLALAVMPWHLITSPNGAVSALAGALRTHHEVTVHYECIRFAELMLASAEYAENDDFAAWLDPETYTRIAEEGFPLGIGELLFAGALYGNDALPPRAVVACEAMQIPVAAAVEMHRLAIDFTEAAAREILAARPEIVGFTTTFCQTIPSLAVARAVKALEPDLPIVFGGSNCDEVMGAALHRNFPEIDFVVRREGERPLTALLEAIDAGDHARLAAIPGLCWRDGAGAPQANREGTDLPGGADLPRMDQTDFFEAIEESPIAEFVQPALILESSRGCWWGQRHHCTFCGLSDLIMPFRAKPAAALVDELVGSVARHELLDILTTDNILEEGYFDSVLPALARADLDLRVMYEIKSNISEERARQLRAAGVVQVQPGIEGLHSLPLKLMHKGTTGTNNLAALRNLQEHGITALWNYLIGFPGETDQCYREVIQQIPLIYHIQPPPGVFRIALERFNPYFDDPGLGFPERWPRPWYRDAFPRLSEADLVDVAYIFETPDQGIGPETIQHLQNAIDRWRDAYPRSSLTHRRVRSGLYLYDRRANRPPADYLLDDPMEIAAYGALAKGRSPDSLVRSLKDNGWNAEPAWAERFMAEMVDLGLLFQESGRAVTLSTAFNISLVRGPAAPVPTTSRGSL